MDGIRSCEQCKYGPNFISCQMGKTGKPKPSDSSNFEFDPFKVSPTRYYLHNPNQMPCFQPCSEMHNAVTSMVSKQQSIEIKLCAACKYGPSIWECQLGQGGKEARYEAFWSDMYHMPCFEPQGNSSCEKRGGIIDSILTSREERANYKKELIAVALFLLVGAVIIYVVLWLISQ
ncbi:MAG: hypothetical protein FJ005_03635 [Chloroflexi bacterium]|nr:hypothetical protein [Chloroflexota bacterium]